MTATASRVTVTPPPAPADTASARATAHTRASRCAVRRSSSTIPGQQPRPLLGARDARGRTAPCRPGPGGPSRGLQRAERARPEAPARRAAPLAARSPPRARRRGQSDERGHDGHQEARRAGLKPPRHMCQVAAVRTTTADERRGRDARARDARGRAAGGRARRAPEHGRVDESPNSWSSKRPGRPSGAVASENSGRRP